MKIENVMKAMELIKKGTYTHFEYVSELPVKAEFKKQGIRIFKYTKMTARFGINYSNIKSVIDRRISGMQSSKPKNNDFGWIVKHVISYNSNTGNTSLHVYTGANSKANNMYFIVTPDNGFIVDSNIFNNEYSQYIIPSYFKKTNKNEVFQVNIKNVVMIGGVK